MTAHALERRTFSVSRAADFIDRRALVSQTGQPEDQFGEVVVKELIDNGLDACETAGVPPEITVTVAEDADGQRVTVEDNGPGVPDWAVGRILDFTTLTSDKALYRSPARGMQGNALKTIIGIASLTGPAVIEARGVRHVIRVSLDAAGNLRTAHDPHPSPRQTGTACTVPLPAGLDLDVAGWVRGYALVNPHASFTAVQLGHDGSSEAPEIYKSTAGDDWHKPVPTDPTSAWWYDAAAITRLAAAKAAAGEDLPIGAFAAEFRGLRGTGKRKQIAAAVPYVKRLSDLTDTPGAAAHLLTVMQAASAEPKVTVLGQVPEAHYRDLLDELYGVERHWYRHGGLVHRGIAWHIEVIIAETGAAGAVTYATNYAVSFGDPLGGTSLNTAEVSAYGAGSFLSQCDAAPGWPNGHRRAAVIHVTCAAPVPLDKGKTRLAVPPDVAGTFAQVLWKAAKVLHGEKRQADRQDAAERRAAARARREATRPRMTIREAVFTVIPEAVEQQRGGTDLPFSVHSLFYKIRPLALKLLPPGTKISKDYVELTLIPEWERDHGPIPGMFRQPRGTLHEPHGGRVIALGTRDVEAYVPPDWSYDKILVAEEAGLWEVIEAARLAERYDMAIVLSQGYAAEAVRLLLAKMPPGDVRIFALHDADIAGYAIGRMLGEATARMPDHHVDVTDLGLTIDQAAALGLEAEEFTRDRAIPQTILPRLSPLAAEWFTGIVTGRDYEGKPKKWLGKRVELNAFTSPALIAFIEDGLRDHGASAKVVPPRPVLRHELRSAYESAVKTQVEEIVARLVDVSSITRDVQRIARRRASRTVGRGIVRERLESRREDPWRAVVGREAASQLRESGADLERLVAGMLKARLDEALSENGGTV